MELKLRQKLPVFFCAVLYGALTAYAGLTQAAGIRADGTTATTVQQAGPLEQTDVVNIATPSSAGVSHNTFDRFSIDASGAVMNNSTVNGTSVLAGRLAANPNLSGGSARIILNEVTSSRRSDLNGATELFGDNARYILANPNGITCDGCGFIRTPTSAGDTGTRIQEVLLSTATPALTGLAATPVQLTVDAGNTARLIIGAGGLDASNVDITTLLTRHAKIDGLINALGGELNLYTGAGTLEVNTTGEAGWQASAANNVNVAIDASAAGAMYAGQIFIRATEDGAGVSLPDDLLSSGSIDITAAGDIVYRDATAQSGDIHVATTGSTAQITTTGNTSAAGDINWDMGRGGEIQGRGAAGFSAGGDIHFNCAGGEGSCSVQSRRALTLQAVNLNTQADITTSTGNDLNINANLTSERHFDSGGALHIAARDGDIRSTGRVAAAGDLTLVTAAGARLILDGELQSGGELYLQGDGHYLHDDIGSYRVAGDWHIDLHSLTNRGTLADLAGGQLSVIRLTNEGLIENQGALILQVDETLTNSDTGIIASLEGAVRIGSRDGGATGVLHNRGTIAALDLTNNQNGNAGLVLDPSDLIAAHTRAILAGEQRSARDLLDDIRRANDRLVAELNLNASVTGLVSIHAETLTNTGEGRISGSDVQLEIGTLNNHGGEILAGRNLTVQGASVNNTYVAPNFGVLSAGNQLTLDLSHQLTNTGIIDAQNVDISAPSQTNSDSGGDVSSRGGATLDTAGYIDALNEQLWFDLAESGSGYEYEFRRLYDNQVLESDTARLTDDFLAAGGAELGADERVVGDDVYIAELLMHTLRADGGVAFVTDDRNGLSQLSTLYDNSLAYMQATGLGFGQTPSAGQRVSINEPVLIFTAREQADGSRVYVPQILMPDDGGIDRQAEQLRTQIRARENLFLQGETILNRDADLIAGNNLVVEAVDLTLEGSERDWYVDAGGNVHYRSARIEAGNDLLVELKGNYVQDGAQVLAGNQLVVQARRIDIADSRSQPQNHVGSRSIAYNPWQGLLGLSGERARSSRSVQVQDNATYDVASDDRPDMQGNSVTLLAENDINLRRADIRATARRSEDGHAYAGDGDDAGSLILVAEQGSITNTAGYLKGDSVYMQAKKDITSETLISVHDNRNYQYQTGQRPRQYGYSVERDNSHSYQETEIRSQYTQTDVAAIEAGEGGLIQVAEGDIRNLGTQVTSGGDIIQQAEGNIENRSLAQQYLQQQVIQYSSQSGGDWSNTTWTNSTSYGLTRQDTRLIAEGDILQDSGGRIENIGTEMQAGGDILQQAKSGVDNSSLLAGTRSSTSSQIHSRGYGNDRHGWSNRYDRNQSSTSTQIKHQDALSSLQAGGDIVTEVDDGDYRNSGNLQAGGDVAVSARDIRNTHETAGRNNPDEILDAGRIKAAGDIVMSAGRDISDNASRYQADGHIFLQAERDIAHTADIRHSASSFNAGGTVSLDAGGNVTLAGSDMDAEDIDLRGKNVTLNALQQRRQTVTYSNGAYQTEHSVRHDVVNLNSRGSLLVQAENDLTTYGSRLVSGMGSGQNTDDHLMLNAGGDMYLLGVNDVDHAYYRQTKDVGFGGKKTTIKETHRVTLVETELHSGGHVLLNVDSEGVRDSGRVVLEGTRIDAGEDVMMYAGKSLDMLSGIEYSYSRYEKHKRGFAGLSKSGEVHEEEAKRLGHATVNSGGDTIMLSAGDITVVSGEINAQNIVADAGYQTDEDAEASINIIGEQEALSTFDHEYNRSFVPGFDGGFLSIAEENHRRNWKVDEKYTGSRFDASNSIDLRANTDINIVGSELTAANTISLEAGQDINLLAGAGSTLDRTETTQERVGVGISADRNSINAFAGRELYTVDDSLATQTVHASVLQAGNRIQLDAENDIKQVSSDVVASGDVTYRAEGNINLGADLAYETKTHSETLRRDGVSVCVNHNAGNTWDAVNASNDSDNAVSTVSGTLQTIDTVNSFMSGPTADGLAGTSISSQSITESTAMARGSVVQAGGNINMAAANDIDIRAGQLIATDDIYLSGEDISITAVENQYQQSTESRSERYGVVANAGGNSVSIGLAGYYNEEETDHIVASGQAGMLTAGGNIDINANNDLLISSSDLDAGNNIDLTAGWDIQLLAQGFRSEYDEDAGNGGGEVGVAATVGEGGASLGVYGSVSLGENELNRDGISYRNSHVNAGNNVTMTSGRDTRVQGATVEGENLSLDVGRNLSVASIQDTEEADGQRWDASGRVVVGTGVSVSASAGYGETDGEKAWVDEQTRLIGRNSVEIDVEGHTQIDGAMIANIDAQGNDKGNLRIDTGTLAYRDLYDYNEEESYYVNVSLNMSDGGNSDSGGSVGGSLSGYYSDMDKERISRATIGNGSITIRDKQDQSLAGLNRDVNRAQQVTKDRQSYTSFYVSDSSVNAVLNPQATLERWGDNALNYHNNTLEVLNNLGRGAAMGGDALGALGDILEGKNVQDALKGTWVDMAARTASWQLTKYGSPALKDAAQKIKDMEKGVAAQAEAALQVYADLVAELAGVDRKLVITAIQADRAGVNFKAATDHKTVFVNFSAPTENENGELIGGTSVSQSGDAITSVAHDVGHVAGIEDEDIAESVGQTAATAWQSDLDWYGYGADTYDAEADANWGKGKENTAYLKKNTETFYQSNPGEMDFRQFNFDEAQYLSDARKHIEASPYSEAEKNTRLYKLDAIACALKKCAEGLPESGGNPATTQLLKQYQRDGEALLAENESLKALAGEDPGELFNYDWKDELNDAINRYEKVIVKGKGAVDAGVGGAGAVASGLGTVASAPLCTSVVGCAVPVGLGALTLLSGKQAYDGMEILISDFSSTQDQWVLGSFAAETHPGDVDYLTSGAGQVAFWGGEVFLFKRISKMVPEKVEDWIQEKIYGDRSHSKTHNKDSEQGPTDQQLLDKLIKEREKKDKPGDATLATGKAGDGTVTPIRESIPGATRDQDIHAEPQVLKDLTGKPKPHTVVVDSEPCDRCRRELRESDARTLVPQDVKKPERRPKSSAVKAAEGKTEVVPREVNLENEGH